MPIFEVFAEFAPEIFEDIDMAGGAAGTAMDVAGGSADLLSSGAPEYLSPSQEAYLRASTASSAPGITQGVQPLPPAGLPQVPNVAPEAFPSADTSTATRSLNAASQMTNQPLTEPPLINPETGQQYSLQMPPSSGIDGLQRLGEDQSSPSAIGKWWGGLSPFEKGMTAYAAATGAARLGLFGLGSVPSALQPYSGSLSKYSMSPNFQPRIADPTQFQYTPRRMAEGGIASVPGYAAGSKIDDPMYYYDMMTRQPSSASEGSRAPSIGFDTGIYHDTDPDTQRLDALTAAQIRQAKLDKRTTMQGQGMPRPTPMGQLNLTPPGVTAAQAPQYQDLYAAKGGIMQASDLGGYAAGGNPRLLKGPGDGMSDNIPAMIGERQPARLADGEFVVPADVVSHLGNGSTEAGAKKLDQMMGKVRKARTGNPKQGKQINPDKYMPK
jgi:hypothetical protein